MQKFESGYKVNGGVNGKTGKRHKLKQKLSSSKRNSGESDQWTSSLVQDHEGNLHDPECVLFRSTTFVKVLMML